MNMNHSNATVLNRFQSPKKKNEIILKLNPHLDSNNHWSFLIEKLKKYSNVPSLKLYYSRRKFKCGLLCYVSVVSMNYNINPIRT